MGVVKIYAACKMYLTPDQATLEIQNSSSPTVAIKWTIMMTFAFLWQIEFVSKWIFWPYIFGTNWLKYVTNRTKSKHVVLFFGEVIKIFAFVRNFGHLIFPSGFLLTRWYFIFHHTFSSLVSNIGSWFAALSCCNKTVSNLRVLLGRQGKTHYHSLFPGW